MYPREPYARLQPLLLGVRTAGLVAVGYKSFEVHCVAAVRSAAVKIRQIRCFDSVSCHSRKLSAAAGLAGLEGLQQHNTTAWQKVRLQGGCQEAASLGSALTLLLQEGGATLLLCWHCRRQGEGQLGAMSDTAAKGGGCTHNLG